MTDKLCEFCGKRKARIRFCSNKCKDRYHNLSNPRGYFKHLRENLDYENGWDAHKDWY